MAAIEAVGLTKRFGGVTAVSDLDLVVEPGEVFGFLGPNGAGKSTTIDALLGYVRPTSGTATVLGMDVGESAHLIRSRTGVLPDGYGLYGRLTGREHLAFVSRSKGTAGREDHLLDRVGLADAADRRTGGYSRGMCQRLAIAMALVDDPDLLVLDEPTSGLDPNGVRLLRAIVQEENERGATVFFSSHALDQVEAVCDRVAIVDDGRLVAVDTVDGLRQSTPAGNESTGDRTLEDVFASHTAEAR